MSRARIGVLDLGMGNLRSVANALDHLGFDHALVTAPDALDDCTHLVMPGVGAFHTAVQRMHAAGLTRPVRAFAASGRPLLGLCLGMQLLATSGVEGAATLGLDLLPGRVERLAGPTIPHVGWNSIDVERSHPLLDGLRPHADFYFVHSYHVVPSAAHVLATTQLDHPIVAAVGADNVAGFQFHPEKSQRNGLMLLERFCRWDGAC